MKSEIPIEKYLDAIFAFQKKYPQSHVGGSIGLWLQGVDLLRPLTKSDLDFTMPDYAEDCFEEKFEDTSSNQSDFNYSGRYKIDGHNCLYIKIEVRVCPEPLFDSIILEGVCYNVSKKRDILFWKDTYARRGSQKHIDDLEAIKTGTRPAPPDIAECIGIFDDDLPF